ncbi:MAG: sigma-70 family RNA polymerase sigma factor [Dehalococcoidia bacterium]|nr:sigma-70 family RNA polymerase sigma factor [Dehalococcoidia bacterium]
MYTKRIDEIVTDAGLELLIERAKSDDADAFGKLYDMYIDRIYRHVYYRVGNAADSEDLTQEVFMKAWQAIGKYKITGTPFLAWLMRISHNLVVDFYRKKKKDELHLDDDSWITDSAPIPEEAAELGYGQKRLRRAILELHGDQQQVLMMHFIEGFTYAEIASSLGKREGAIRVIQHRALTRLRQILEKEKDVR